MGEVGKSAKQALEFLLQFFTHTSKLLVAVDEGLAKIDFESIHPACYWDASKAVYAPTHWVPRCVHRLYGKTPLLEDRTTVPMAVFLSVYFTPKCASEPVAAWGIAAQSKPESLYPRFNALLYAPDGPKFLDREREVSWRSVPDFGFNTFEFCACPLVELASSQVVDEKILQPIFDRLKTLPDA